MMKTVSEDVVMAALRGRVGTLSAVAARCGAELTEVLSVLRNLGTAQKVCASRQRVGGQAVGPVLWHMPDTAVPARKALMPTPPAALPVADDAGRPGAHEDAPRTAIERLSPLALRSTYRVPVGGRSTAPGNPVHDLLLALSNLEDQLGAEMAIAMACGWAGKWQQISALADVEMGDPRSQLAAAARGCRRRSQMKLVLFDVFQALVAGPRQRLRDGAKAVGVRERTYGTLYGKLANMLSLRAMVAAYDAHEALHAEMSEEDRRWIEMLNRTRRAADNEAASARIGIPTAPARP